MNDFKVGDRITSRDGGMSGTITKVLSKWYTVNWEIGNGHGATYPKHVIHAMCRLVQPEKPVTPKFPVGTRIGNIDGCWGEVLEVDRLCYTIEWETIGRMNHPISYIENEFEQVESLAELVLAPGFVAVTRATFSPPTSAVITEYFSNGISLPAMEHPTCSKPIFKGWRKA